MFWDIAEMVVGLGLGAIEQKFDPSRSLNAYKDFFSAIRDNLRFLRSTRDTTVTKNSRANAWTASIRSCFVAATPFPTTFPSSRRLSHPLLAGGPDLPSLRDAGRLYLLDLSILEHVPVAPGRFLCAPMCLFYVDGRSRLMPLAIQLGHRRTPARFSPRTTIPGSGAP